MKSYYRIMEFKEQLRSRQRSRTGSIPLLWPQEGTAGSHLNPAPLLRWKRLQRRNHLRISLPHLSLSFCMYLKPLLKSLFYSDVFIINYAIWDHYSHTHTRVRALGSWLCSSAQQKTSLSVEPSSHSPQA